MREYEKREITRPVQRSDSAAPIQANKFTDLFGGGKKAAPKGKLRQMDQPMTDEEKEQMAKLLSTNDEDELSEQV